MQQVAQQKSDHYSFDNRLMPDSAANVQLMAQPSAPQAAAMPSANFDPQQQVGSFSNKMSDYQAPKQAVNPTGSDTPLLDKNQKTFFDMPKSPVTPDGYQWDDNALQNYGFQGAELDRVKTADFSNPHAVNYYVSQGWLRKNDPQSIEEVLATPSDGGGSSEYAPEALPANENPAANAGWLDAGASAPDNAATPQDSGAALDYDPAQQQLHEDILAEMKRRHGEDIVNSPYYDGIYDNIYNELKNPITFGQGQLNPFM